MDGGVEGQQVASSCERRDAVAGREAVSDEAASDPPSDPAEGGGADESQTVTLALDIADDVTLAQLAANTGPITPRPAASTPRPAVAPGSVLPPTRTPTRPSAARGSGDGAASDGQEPNQLASACV